MLDLDRALDDLAPEVDPAASRALFDRHRAGMHRAPAPLARNRRLAVLAAAIVVLLVGVVAALVVGPDRTTTLDVGGSGQPASDGTAPPGTIASPPIGVGPPQTTPVTTEEPLGSVEVPGVGAIGSGLLDDATPVWVAHHPDGSLSVLPALIEDGYADPSADEGAEVLDDRLSGPFELVDAVGNTGFRSRLLEWDAWGRSWSGDRSLDLTGYVGLVVDGRVQVLASPMAPIPGEPASTPPPPPGEEGSQTPPALPDPLPSAPDQISSVATASPGWHRITDLVQIYGSEDTFRICPGTLDGGFRVDVLDACTGPVIHGVTGPARREVVVVGDPVLVRVDEAGEIVGVAFVARRGSSWDRGTAT